jgi:hypothetical protein
MENENINEAQYKITIALPETVNGFSKSEMERVANEIISKVDDGTLGAPKLYIEVDFIIKSLTKVKDGIKEDAFDEFIKYDKGQKYFGVRFETRNSTTYDYTGNPEWVKLDKDRKEIEKEMKAACNSTKMFVDEDSGDIVIPARIKSSSSSVSPTYPKA